MTSTFSIIQPGHENIDTYCPGVCAAIPAVYANLTQIEFGLLEHLCPKEHSDAHGSDLVICVVKLQVEKGQQCLSF